MSRLILLLLGVVSPLVLSAPSNLHTVLSPFSLSPSVEIIRSPVSRLETIQLPTTTTITKGFSPSTSAVAIASTSSQPVLQRIESYSSGGSSNTEIRDLLRSLLSQLRTTSNTRSSTLTSPQPFVSDSYGAPPRNTVSDPNAPTYPDSFDNSRRHNNNNDNKPEKVVSTNSGQERQSAQLVQESPVQYREIVRTVYQPVYVPYQYAQYAQYAQPEVLTVAQPSLVPTRINTGSSAVAFSTIHSSPAYAIQQQQPQLQQLSLPLVQSVQQPFAQAYASTSGAILDESVGYLKK